MSYTTPPIEESGYEEAIQFTFTILRPIKGEELKPHLLCRSSCGCENKKCLGNYSWKEVMGMEFHSLICKDDMILEKGDVLQIKYHSPSCYYTGYFNDQYTEI